MAILYKLIIKLYYSERKTPAFDKKEVTMLKQAA